MLTKTARLIISSLTSSIIAILAVVALTPAPASADSFSCTSYNLPVNLSAADPTVYHVFGTLCSQGPTSGKTVQFLIHGISYDHNYMNWPTTPQKYSYTKQATDSGYVTFNIDRIGIGLSDHPLSTLVNLQSNAFVVHQLVQDLRNGTIGGTHFPKVILVGHSFGSNISLYEESTYQDADALLLSALMHQLNPQFLPVAFSDIYPASQDPKFANSHFPGLYFTTIPGVRGSVFYNQSDADPNVIALDEQLKQTVTDGELNSIFDSLAPNYSLSIHVPVLLAIGQKDFLFCNPSAGLSCQDSSAILARESTLFSPQACLEAFVLPNSGHSINLHLNAKNWFESAIDWADRRIGQDSSNPPTQPCH